MVVSVVMGTSSWCDCAGLVSQAQTGGRSVSKGSGITRGDRRRNARKARLRALVPRENAVLGLDLGEKRQALTVAGADGRVLARRSPQVSVHDLGPCLSWALERARVAGYAGLSVACEPAGRGGWRCRICARCGPCRLCACSRWSLMSRGSRRT